MSRVIQRWLCRQFQVRKEISKVVAEKLKGTVPHTMQFGVRTIHFGTHITMCRDNKKYKFDVGVNACVYFCCLLIF